MKESLSTRLRKTLEEHGWIRAGDRVGVAVSGGADSVALLMLLEELKDHLGVVISVVHFNHQLRGRSSDADENNVATLARSLGLPFHTSRADVKALAKRDKSNLENCARRARYEFFAELVEKEHLNWIAVAHTADDQAETVLAHILRGTGLTGLGGIHPVIGHIVRPLLGFRRAELRAYLRSKKQAWREDATNRDTTRMRARIRKKLIPLLEKQFQPRAVEHLADLANLAREDEAFLSDVVKARFDSCVELKAQSARILVSDLSGRASNSPFSTQSAKTSLAIARRLVRLIVKKVKPAMGQLGSEHVNAVLQLAARGKNGNRLPLPGGVEVRWHGQALSFTAASRDPFHRPVKREFERRVNINGAENKISVPELSCVFRFRVIDWPRERGDTIDKGSVLDRNALRQPLLLRNWRDGDRFRPLGHQNAHKVKHLLSETRVAASERDGWPVLTSGGAIAWTRGLPVAAEFAASGSTRSGVVISEESAS